MYSIVVSMAMAAYDDDAAAGAAAARQSCK